MSPSLRAVALGLVASCSLALVIDDPDAPDPARPKRVWVHWVVLDIPPTVTSLPEGASVALPAGARTGTNDWARPSTAGRARRSVATATSTPSTRST